MAEPKLYLRTGAARRWQQAVRAAGDILAFSPYLTDCEMTAALAARGGRCSLYTVASVENLASGASSLACLRTLVAAGVRVYHLPGLHAKMLLVPGRLVTVGSQNFTAGGAVNREATVALKGARVARQAHDEVQDWIEGGNPVLVTNEVLAVLEAEVERLRPAYQQLHGETRQATEQVWDQERVRQEQERLEAERLERERQAAELARAAAQRQQEEWARQLAAQARLWPSPPAHRRGRRDTDEVRYAGAVHVARLVGWSLNADPGSNLLRWEIDGRVQPLDKSVWYPCHLRESCRWGWGRLYPSCISFVAQTRQNGREFSLAGHRYTITPGFRWEGDERQGNVALGLWRGYRYVRLSGRLTTSDLCVWLDDDVPPEDREVLARLARGINENENGINAELRWFILKPLIRHPLKHASPACNFFGGQTRHDLHLGVATVPYPAGSTSPMPFLESF